MMKKKEQVFLCIIRRNNDEEEASRRRRCRGGKKNSIGLGAAKAQVSPGMTEKAKRKMSKIVGPKRTLLTLEEREKEMIKNTAEGHRDEKQRILAEYRDVFLDQLAEGAPPSRSVKHSI